VILTESNINDLFLALDKVVNKLRMIEACVLLVALTEHSPVAAAEQIKLAVLY